MSCKFRINDEVIIITGKDKGKKGIIKKIRFNKVIVNNINLVYKNIKSNPINNIVGKIIKRESWIDISNISHFIIDKNNKIIFSKIGFKYLENKKKIRYLKYNNKNLLVDKK